MLSLLAGPIDITPLDSLETDVRVRAGAGMWCDDRGLYFSSDIGSDHVGELYVVHINGKACRIGTRAGPLVSAVGWSAEDRVPTFADTWSNWRKCTLPAMGDVGVIHTLCGPATAVMADRQLTYGGNWVKYRGYDSAGPDVLEYTFADPPPLGAGPRMMLYAGKENNAHLWWCLDCANGSLQKYDATNKTLAPGLARTSIGACRMAGYSVKHRIFVSVRRNEAGLDQLFVHGADEPAVATLSAVEVAPAARRGGMSVVRTRALGDVEEACASRNVRFSVDQGTLEQEVVATDANGWATTRYFGPVGRGEISATVTATLEE